MNNHTNVNGAQTSALVTGIVILALAAFSAYETGEAHRSAAGPTDTRAT